MYWQSNDKEIKTTGFNKQMKTFFHLQFSRTTSIFFFHFSIFIIPSYFKMILIISGPKVVG